MSDFIDLGKRWDGVDVTLADVISPSRILWPCVYCSTSGHEPQAAYANGAIAEESDTPCRVCYGTRSVEIELFAKPKPCPECRGYGRTAGRLIDLQDLRREKQAAAKAKADAERADRMYATKGVDPREFVPERTSPTHRQPPPPPGAEADDQTAEVLPTHQPIFCGKCQGIGLGTEPPARAIKVWPYGAPQDTTTQKAKRLLGKFSGLRIR